MCGLSDKDLQCIIDAVKKYEEIDKAVIFGSRAMGNYKKGSDIDLCIFGQNITNSIVAELYDYLDEVAPLPYFFDLLHYEKLNNENLKKHIEQVGKLIYSRK